jgi:NACHT domain
MMFTSSAIIEEIKTLQESGHASFAMYYYDFREDKKRDLCGLLTSVLFQLCEQSDSNHPILSTFYSTHLNGARTPSDGELIRCLIDLLKLPGSQPIYLIVDALDECPSTSSLSSPREELLSLLEDLVEEELPNLRICVTSRPEVDIKAILEPLTFRSVSLHDESGQKKDIMKYIESIVYTNKNMKDWNPKQKQLVIDVLTEKADGM